jgi:hypothetical protein
VSPVWITRADQALARLDLELAERLGEPTTAEMRAMADAPVTVDLPASPRWQDPSAHESSPA